MKTVKFILLILFVSACSSGKEILPQPSTSQSDSLPPAWTKTPEPPTNTPSFPTVPPSSTPKPLPVEGCHARFISDGVVQDRIPSLSMDGQAFVYLCGTQDSSYICVMGKEGDDPAKILGETRSLTNPQWSPTERMIAYVQRESFKLQDYGFTPSSDIYLLSPAGEIRSQVTNNPTMVHQMIEEIQWSPDGKRIAFSTGGNIGSEALDIYVINSDGTGLRRLSYPPSRNYSPRWSPDGSRLAYYTVSDNDVRYLVLIDLRSDDDFEVRGPLHVNGAFSWSPNGKSILYDYSPDWHSDVHLYRYDLGITSEIQLTSGASSEFSPIWSKDGSTIYFVSNMDASFDLYAMSLEGSVLTKLADNLTDAWIHNPLLSKDGQTIYFFLSGGRKDIYEMWAIDLLEVCE